MFLWLHAWEQNGLKGDTESLDKWKVEFPVTALEKQFPINDAELY